MLNVNPDSFYKLREFQPEIVMKLKSIWSVEEMCKLLKHNSENTHDDFDAYICFTLWYRINLAYDFILEDKIRNLYPDTQDKHIHTLMHKSFKAVYGSSPTNLLKEYEEEYIIF